MKISDRTRKSFFNIFFIRLIGDELVSKLFTIDKRSGQLFINDTNYLDVNRLNSDKVFFSVEVRVFSSL